MTAAMSVAQLFRGLTQARVVTSLVEGIHTTHTEANLLMLESCLAQHTRHALPLRSVHGTVAPACGARKWRAQHNS